MKNPRNTHFWIAAELGKFREELEPSIKSVLMIKHCHRNDKHHLGSFLVRRQFCGTGVKKARVGRPPPILLLQGNYCNNDNTRIDNTQLIINHDIIMILGNLRARKVQFFLTLFKKPPLSFEHYVVNFSEGILTKVRKRPSRQLSTK